MVPTEGRWDQADIPFVPVDIRPVPARRPIPRKRVHLHSYPVRTSRGTAACAAAAPSAPARSILLAPLSTTRATGGDMAGRDRERHAEMSPATLR